MKSFKQYITESVPNRSHGEVFKQFFEMGKKGELPFNFADIKRPSREELAVQAIFGLLKKPEPKPRSSDQMELPAHVMNFPSFKDDSLGRKQSLKIRTIPIPLYSKIKDISPIGYHVQQYSTPSSSTNFIDLMRASTTGDRISTIGHEAFHSVQTARADAPDNRFNTSYRYYHPNVYDWQRGGRKYIDVIGNPRTTNDSNYWAFNKLQDENSPHIKKLLKQNEKKSSAAIKSLGVFGPDMIKDLNRDKENSATTIKYAATDTEHDARLGGAIANLGYDAGRWHKQGKSELRSYKEFHRMVSPYTPRQVKRTRDAYGRIAQAYQDLTGNKINMDSSNDII